MNQSHPPDAPGDRGSGDEKSDLSKSAVQPLTLQELADIWDRLQGEGPIGKQNRFRYSIRDWLADSFVTLLVTRWFHAVAATIGTAGIVVASLLMMGPPQLQMRTETSYAMQHPDRLPDSLQFQIGKKSARLSGSYQLDGHIEEDQLLGGDTTIRQVSFHGFRNGVEIDFKGVLVLTNAPGRIDGRRADDFLGGLLDGKFRQGTNATVDIHQPFLFTNPVN